MNVWKNIVLFLSGFCSYITIEVVFRGVSYPIMGTIGGLAVVILDKLNDKISWELDLIWQCMIGSSLITTMELIIGEIMIRTSLLPVMWDYSNIPLNFDGVICLPFSIAWLFLSCVAIFLADAINYYIFEDIDVPRYLLFGYFLIVFKRRKCDIRAL